jgi:hypothetical protein
MDCISSLRGEKAVSFPQKKERIPEEQCPATQTEQAAGGGQQNILGRPQKRKLLFC